MSETVEAPPLDLPKMIRHVAHSCHGKYQDYTERRDIEQELELYVLEQKRLFARANDVDAFRMLFAAARRYAEVEKAAKLGYSFDDVAWYSPARIAELLPLVTDPGFNGDTPLEGEEVRVASEASDGKNLLVAVMDVRVALDRVGWCMDPVGTEEHEAWLRRLSDAIGGERPVVPGKRAA